MPPEGGFHEETGLENAIGPIRAALGMTQADLAERCGVSRKTINTVERGRFVPSAVLAMKIADALDASVEDVFALRSIST